MALKLSSVALLALLAKVLPKFMFNRAIYKLTGSRLLLMISITVMLALMYWSPVSSGRGYRVGIACIFKHYAVRWQLAAGVAFKNSVVMTVRMCLRFVRSKRSHIFP